ncbi:MAG: SDR family oxidoreductase [Clostridiales bacterium]|nr:SDR family oxidoreductase [Clostridiales bacterium]
MRIALVTGGSRGIGAATVRKFAKEGYSVILNYNKSAEQAEQLKSCLVEDGCDVHCYQADISDPTQVAAMFSWIATYFRRLDVLVNNAGISLTKQLQDVTVRDYDAVMNTNAKAAFFCCQQALPLLRKSDSGAIVNVSSIWGVMGASCESVYSMSKFALVGLTKSLCKELKPLGIRVNCVCPPIVSTDMSCHLSGGDIAAFCSAHKTRLYTPEDVADDIFNLATKNITGKILIER